MKQFTIQLSVSMQFLWSSLIPNKKENLILKIFWNYDAIIYLSFKMYNNINKINQFVENKMFFQFGWIV